MNILFDEPAVFFRTIVVGVLAYLALVGILRVSGKRTLSQLNAFDFIVTVALGSTLATILLSKDVSLAEGVLALALLVGLQYAITWSSLKSDRLARLAKSEPRVLVFRGRMLREAMDGERVLETELRSVIRGAGIGRLEDVDLVVLETDGKFSVLRDLPWDAWSTADVAGLDAQQEERRERLARRIDGERTAGPARRRTGGQDRL